jgi:hypothetical protein
VQIVVDLLQKRAQERIHVRALQERPAHPAMLRIQTFILEFLGAMIELANFSERRSRSLSGTDTLWEDFNCVSRLSGWRENAEYGQI